MQRCGLATGMMLTTLLGLCTVIAAQPPNITWECATTDSGWTARSGHVSVVFDGKMWVLGGYYINDVWYSQDGQSWSSTTLSAPWAARRDHAAVVFNNLMYVMGGRSTSAHLNDVWYSSDGLTWYEATEHAAWMERCRQVVVEYKSAMWLMGGSPPSMNDVWTSTDGVEWFEVASSSPWEGRWGHTLTVFNDKMWIVGGSTGQGVSGTRQNDVWCTENGVDWTLAVEHAPWAPRSGHSTVALDGKLWVIGGATGTATLNDVWSSQDGYTWTQENAQAPWTTRSVHTSVAFDDRLWIFGGEAAIGAPNNETWKSGPLGTTAHSADTDGDGFISMTELLRIAQFFNMRGYCCDTQGITADGYLPGPCENVSCERHDSDFLAPAWEINLNELLRAIQIFNVGGYYACPESDSEDGYCLRSRTTL